MENERNSDFGKMLSQQQQEKIIIIIIAGSR